MVLELVGITKRFPGFTLGPLNLKISDNNILVIIGPTGSGKSTILNLVVGLTKPDSGSIFLDEVDITNMPLESRNIGYVVQRPNLFPFLDVYHNHHPDSNYYSITPLLTTIFPFSTFHFQFSTFY